MKKIFLLATTVFCLSAHAQIKEATIKYKMELTGGPNGADANSILSNTTMTIYFKNESSLTEMVTPMYTMKTLADNKGMMMLMDGGSQKMYTRKTKVESEKDKPKGNEPQIVVTNVKKKILGYDCTQAVVIAKNNKGQESKTVIWYTDKIRCVAAAGLMNSDAMKKIKGMALQVEMDQGFVKSKMTATEISLKPIPDAVFALSTVGYTERKVAAPLKH